MPRVGLTADAIVTWAAASLDANPGSRVNLTEIAADLGVQAPSLYKHVGGVADIEREIALRAKTSLTDALLASTAGRAGDDAVAAIAETYRDWAERHPGQYAFVTSSPHPDDGPAVEVSERLVEVVFAAIRAYGLTEEGMIDATRYIRAVLHGFATLEASGGFALPRDLDLTFDAVVISLQRALADW